MKYCPKRWEAFQKWLKASREVSTRSVSVSIVLFRDSNSGFLKDLPFHSQIKARVGVLFDIGLTISMYKLQYQIPFLFPNQSRSQSPQAFLSAVARLERH